MTSKSDKILAQSKLKAFADDKFIIIKRLDFSLIYRVENIVGKKKEKNVGYHYFLFQKWSTFFQLNKPLLYSPLERSLLKTLWEKEKMLGTSIFFFSTHCFNTVAKTKLFWTSEKAFNLADSKKSHLVKGLKYVAIVKGKQRLKKIDNFSDFYYILQKKKIE